MTKRGARNGHASYLKIHIKKRILGEGVGGGGGGGCCTKLFRSIYKKNASAVEQINDTGFDQLAIYKPSRKVEPGKTETVRSKLEPGITGYYLIYQILDEAGLDKINVLFSRGQNFNF